METTKLKLQKIGNSLMVTIPKHIREKAKLRVGDKLGIRYSGNIIQLMPSKKKTRPITEMAGDLKIKDFDLKESLRYTKEAAYDR